MQRIYVHELLDPDVYVRGRSALVELFKRWTGSPSEERLFQVTQAGMIYFADHSELWRDSEERRALPETADDALKQAERFLDDIRTRFNAKESEVIRKALEECPVPSGTLRIDAVAVLHPRLGLVDHWLCRFAINVNAFPWERAKKPHVHAHEEGEGEHEHDQQADQPTAVDPLEHLDRTKPLRVHDALIEVRIGSKWPGTDRYRIIGYNQRWRPIRSKGRVSTELLPPTHEELEESHDQAGVHQGEAPILVYVLDADSQRFLAPYYLTPSGHHFGFHSASRYSIVLNVLQIDGPAETELFLNVAGGGKKRDFEAHWSYWRPDTIATEGFVYLGQGVKAPKGLPPAVYNIITDVIDKQTGQTKRHQQMVYAGPRQMPDEQPLINA